jgi:phosphatidylglycerophosphate synthase
MKKDSDDMNISAPGLDPTLPQSRRPLKTRATAWAKWLAGALARRRVSPNWISMSSILFAVIGGGAIFGATLLDAAPSQSAAFVFGAVCIQLRLVANMIDGMVAVEGGLGGALGDIYNEFPDRLADVLFIVPAGYVAVTGPWPGGVLLGWTAGSLALIAAYVRALGASVGARHAFHGPMAKPHRMFLLTCACIAAAVGVYAQVGAQVMYVTLVLMVGGTALTIFRRLSAIAGELNGPKVD